MCFVTEQTCIEHNFNIDATRRMSVASFDGRTEFTIGVTEPLLMFLDDKEEHLIKLPLQVVTNGPAPIVLGKSFLNRRAVVDYVDGEARFFTKYTVGSGQEADLSSEVVSKSNNDRKEGSNQAENDKDSCTEVDELILTHPQTDSSTLESDYEQRIRKHVPGRCLSVKDGLEFLFGQAGESLQISLKDSDEMMQFGSKEAATVASNIEEEIIKKFEKVFEEKEMQTFIPNEQMPIRTTETEPICQKVRKIKPSDEKEIQLQVERLQRRGVIEASSSPWGFPVVLVTKSNGSRRMCVDYRRINEVTVRDSYPLPRMEDVIRKHARRKVFSALDIKEGFHHLMVKVEDRPKTAFLTPFGLFHYVGAPFGLKNTPAAYQRVMSNMLASVNDCCGVYIDDILVSSVSESQHVNDLSRVLNVLQKNNISLNVAKCKLFQGSVKVLGRLLDSNGVSVDGKRLEAILNLEFPKTKRQMLSFLGMLSYISNFIPKLADLTMPLRKLVRKSSDFVCRDEHLSAFEEIRRILRSSELRLSFPFDGAVNRVVIYASEFCIGACLFQSIESEDKLIESTSRVLSDCESRYSGVEKQALSVQHAIEKFSCLFGSGDVIVEVTEPALQDVLKKRLLPTRLARIILPIQHIDFKVVLSTKSIGAKDEEISQMASETSEETVDLSILIPNVYVDGSCVANGSDKARASYAAFWSDCHPLNKSGVLPDRGTNQRAEVYAAMVAIETARENNIRCIRIVSDSMYLINCMTKWCDVWVKNDFRSSKGKPVINADLFRKLLALLNDIRVLWQYVPGHAGIYGNEKADQMAKMVLGIETAHLNSISLSESLLINQDADEELKVLRKKITEGRAKRCFVINDELICKEDGEKLLILIPKSMRKTILFMFHDSASTGGHLGVSKTYQAITQNFWWYHIRHDVVDYVNNCHSCQVKKNHGLKKFGNLQPLTSTTVMDRVGLDYIGPFPRSPRGNRYIIIAVDYFSRFAVTRALPNSTAKTTATFILEEICCKHGVPRSILSDQGPQFRSDLIRNLTEMLQIDKQQTAPYSPQCNGLTERVNGTIVRMLKHYVDKMQGNWDQLLPLVTFNYNCKINPATQFSPFEIITGRKPNLFHASKVDKTSTSDFVQDLKERINLIEQKATELMEINHADTQRTFNENREPVNFEEGNQVLVKNFRVSENHCAKFTDEFVGPFKVIKILNKGRNCQILVNGKEKVISTDHAKKYHCREPIEKEQSYDSIKGYDCKSKSQTSLEDILPYYSILRDLSDVRPSSLSELSNSDFHHPNNVVSFSPVPQPSNSQSVHHLDQVVDPSNSQKDANAIQFHDKTFDASICKFSDPEAEVSNPIELPTNCTVIEIVQADDQESELASDVIERRAICHICQRRFASTYNLRRHMRTHSTEDGFPCSKCPRFFKTEAAKHKHEFVPHPLPYVCITCQGGFANRRELSKHSKIHAGVLNG